MREKAGPKRPLAVHALYHTLVIYFLLCYAPQAASTNSNNLGAHRLLGIACYASLPRLGQNIRFHIAAAGAISE
jgi:hypothetical protein